MFTKEVLWANLHYSTSLLKCFLPLVLALLVVIPCCKRFFLDLRKVVLPALQSVKNRRSILLASNRNHAGLNSSAELFASLDLTDQKITCQVTIFSTTVLLWNTWLTQRLILCFLSACYGAPISRYVNADSRLAYFLSKFIDTIAMLSTIFPCKICSARTPI